LKRVLTQKVKPFPACAVDNEATAGNIKPVPAEPNRRVCTSAAMIGLAISMGASSLLLPRQGDGAIAAESGDGSPIPTVPAAANPAAFAGEQEGPQPLASGEEQRQTVESKTQTERVDRTASAPAVTEPGIAAANPYRSNSTTAAEVKIPALMGREHQVNPIAVQRATRPYSDAHATQTEYSGIVTEPFNQSGTQESSGSQSLSEAVTNPNPVNDLVKAKQAVALNRLRDSSNRLRNSLAEWKSEESTNPSAQVTEPSKPFVIPNSLNPTGEPPSESAEVFDGKPKAIVTQPVTPSFPEPIATQLQSPTGQSSTTPSTLPQVIVPEPTESTSVGTVYKVKPGDTLSQIAQHYGVSPVALAKANQLENPNRLRIAQRIAIPQDATTAWNPNRAVVETAYNPSEQQLAQSEPSLPVPSTPVVSVVPGLSIDPKRSGNASATPDLDTDASQAEFNGKLATVSAQSLSGTKQLAVGEPEVAKSEEELVLNEDDDSSVLAAKPKQNRNPYVERLRAEISQMRQQYQHQNRFNRGNSATEPDSETVSASPVNPEFNPNRYNEALQAEIQRRAAQQPANLPSAPTARPQPAAAFPRTQQQTIAVAPAGPDAYGSYRPSRGQMVSPELPPLGDPNLYLPGGPAQNFNGFIWPAKGVLTSGYGPRWGRMHKGIDIAAPTGTPIFAAAPGVVVYARWNRGGYGNLVDIRHADGSLTRYAHNSRILVQEGQAVEQGQQISAMGSTGHSTGPHLHFEVHPGGRGAVNPMAFLPSRSR
jgi:murein DD-endopeptidase MepM/ murein hydrolase activator NlpD